MRLHHDDQLSKQVSATETQGPRAGGWKSLKQKCPQPPRSATAAQELHKAPRLLLWRHPGPRASEVERNMARHSLF